MSLIEKYIKGIRFLLPSPFSIAVLLTLFTFIMAFSWPNNIYAEDLNGLDKFTYILKSWNNGLWNVQGYGIRSSNDVNAITRSCVGIE